MSYDKTYLTEKGGFIINAKFRPLNDVFIVKIPQDKSLSLFNHLERHNVVPLLTNVYHEEIILFIKNRFLPIVNKVISRDYIIKKPLVIEIGFNRKENKVTLTSNLIEIFNKHNIIVKELYDFQDKFIILLENNKKGDIIYLLKKTLM